MMTMNEAKDFMVKTIEKLVNTRRYDASYVQGQAVGMVKAFKALGIIPKNNVDILDELEEMI